jgi:hypothetical protein
VDDLNPEVAMFDDDPNAIQVRRARTIALA